MNSLANGLFKRKTSNSFPDFEIEKILEREQIELNCEKTAELISGKCVMVTGAGGSIGSELVRQLSNYQPNKILLVERSEFALFSLDWELRQSNLELEIIPLLIDINDKTSLQKAFVKYQPQIIFHAAAHKHVPLMEAHPAEAFRNNSLATKQLAELAGEHKTETFVFISTDKAVKPVSIMGASKRIAELIMQECNQRFETNFISVRFGNVFGSNGSVIPIFLEQIKRGGPVTVTHSEMLRYFMTIEEAVSLVLQAGVMGNGGEIFSLNLGKPLKIIELAKKIVEMSGCKDIEIVVSGTRPGEKIIEEPLFVSEDQKTNHPQIYFADEKLLPPEIVEKILEDLNNSVEIGDEKKLKKQIIRSCEIYTSQSN
jgi:FlaA1/EpsC-like NDP-sugar epimerase